MTRSVSFLLGAGFSAPFDVPTMRPFMTSFTEFARQKYPNLMPTLDDHLKKLEDDSDLEALLSSLTSAQELGSALPSPCHMTCDQKQWATASRSLRAHLVSYIIERCERFDRELARQRIEPLLSRLNTANGLFEIHLFTTNYDRILEYVAETAGIELHDGFEHPTGDLVAPWTGSFDSRCRLYKLHGSVTYYVDRRPDLETEFIRLDRGYPLPDPDFRLSRQGRQLEPLMVLPTDEKVTTGDPYGNLMHTFTRTLTAGGLVVAIGTSFRDAHLVNAMNFSAADIVVLVIDEDPEAARQRIPRLTSVPLRVDTTECLVTLCEPLVGLAEQCASVAQTDEVLEEVSRFAEEQAGILRARGSLTEEQRSQIAILEGDGDYVPKMESILHLQGVSDSAVIEVLSTTLRSPESHLDLRKAAAGCLGLSGCDAAVEELAGIATEDDSPDLRLECYLGLREIGGNRAIEVLKTLQKTWPEDPFFYREA